MSFGRKPKLPYRPPLRSDNLVLRPLERTDAKVVAELAGDWEVARWTSDIPHPYDTKMAREFIDWSQGELASQRRFILAMVARASGELVGIISLTCNGAEEGEIGYWVGRPYQGRGFAGEAAAAAADGDGAAGDEDADADDDADDDIDDDIDDARLSI